MKRTYGNFLLFAFMFLAIFSLSGNTTFGAGDPYDITNGPLPPIDGKPGIKNVSIGNAAYNGCLMTVGFDAYLHAPSAGKLNCTIISPSVVSEPPNGNRATPYPGAFWDDRVAFSEGGLDYHMVQYMMSFSQAPMGNKYTVNIACENGDGRTFTRQVIMRDMCKPIAPPAAPTVTFTAEEVNPPASIVNKGSVITIPSGSSALLKWSATGATSCAPIPAPYAPWNTGGSMSNTGTGVSTGVLSSTKTYGLQCMGSNGFMSVQAFVTVKIPKVLICPRTLDLTSAIPTGQLNAYYFPASKGDELCTTASASNKVTTSNASLWESDAPTIASVNNADQKGLVTAGTTKGTANVKITYPFSGSRTIFDRISVSVAGTYSCNPSTIFYARLCPDDSIGLTESTTSRLVGDDASLCTPLKCEFFCEPGYHHNVDKTACVPNTTAPSGDLWGNACTVDFGESICSTRLNWHTENVTNGSIFRNPNGNEKSDINSDDGDSFVSVNGIGQSPTTFSLYSGSTKTGTPLDTISLQGTCSGDWVGGKCTEVMPPTPTKGNSGFREVTP